MRSTVERLLPHIAGEAVQKQQGPLARPLCSANVGPLRTLVHYEHRRAENDYCVSCDQTSGNTGVPSALTASKADGFNPNAFRIVGATWVVAVSAETV
jgi:hypothetical protein